MSSCPLHHSKSPCMDILTLCGYPHLTFTSCAPLYMKIISFTSYGKIPKKSRSNPNSIKVPLTSHQLSSNLKFYIKLNSYSKFIERFELEDMTYFKFPVNSKENLAVESFRINRTRPVWLLSILQHKMG